MRRTTTAAVGTTTANGAAFARGGGRLAVPGPGLAGARRAVEAQGNARVDARRRDQLIDGHALVVRMRVRQVRGPADDGRGPGLVQDRRAGPPVTPAMADSTARASG